MPVARLPLLLTVTTFALFVTGNVLGWVTHDPQTAGDWGGGGSPALAAISLALFTFSVVGALVASRQPANAIGWLLLGVAFVWALDTTLEGYAMYGLRAHPGSVPGPEYANALDDWLWVVSIGTMGTFLFLLFPDGRSLGRLWRIVGWIAAAAMAVTVVATTLTPGTLKDSAVTTAQNPFGIGGLGFLASVAAVSLGVLICCVPASAVGLIVRYRRSHGAARMQMKWLASATAAIVLFYAVVVSISGGAGPAPTWLQVMQDGTVLSFGLIPLAIGAAVLRYHLYDIDVIVRKTVVYAVLVAVLAGVYLAGVTLLGWAGRQVTGQSGALAVTLSTLLVAASFQPLRARIRSAVDRRFYRSRYDAEAAAARFSGRLRSQVDLEAVRHDLLEVVHTTVQPSQAVLWLRTDNDA
jgi:hypothetical protein